MFINCLGTRKSLKFDDVYSLDVRIFETEEWLRLRKKELTDLDKIVQPQLKYYLKNDFQVYEKLNPHYEMIPNYIDQADSLIIEISKLLERGVEIKTLDKRLDTTSMPKEITMLIVSILGYAASQELDAIKTRTKEGREVAKTRGVKFGRKRTYDKYQIQEILEKRNEGQGYGTIARSMGMNRGTVQKIINRENGVVGIQ